MSSLDSALMLQVPLALGHGLLSFRQVIGEHGVVRTGGPARGAPRFSECCIGRHAEEPNTVSVPTAQLS